MIETIYTLITLLVLLAFYLVEHYAGHTKEDDIQLEVEKRFGL